MVAPKEKWKFAIGTTSRVPNSGGLHYLIADFDLDYLPLNDLIELGGNTLLIQKTEHGYHVYSKAIYTFDDLITRLVILNADPAWIQIGTKRGYFFLADKDFINFPWPVEHMTINWNWKSDRRWFRYIWQRKNTKHQNT